MGLIVTPSAVAYLFPIRLRGFALDELSSVMNLPRRGSQEGDSRVGLSQVRG